jgi:hypothetical protein
MTAANEERLNRRELVRREGESLADCGGPVVRRECSPRVLRGRSRPRLFLTHRTAWPATERGGGRNPRCGPLSYAT